MATSQVDGSIKIYKFNSFNELSKKHKEGRVDITFKDHFYSANKVDFARNNKDVNGQEITSGVGGH